MVAATLPAALNVLGVAAAFALLYAFRSVLWPFALALVLAILINALVRTLVHAWPRASRLTVFILAGAVVGALVLLSTVLVAAGATELLGQAPMLVQRLDELLALGSRWAELEAPLSLRSLAGGANLASLAGAVLAGLQNAVSGMLLTLLFLSFILVSRHLIEEKLRIIAASGGGARMLAVLDRTVRGVETYVWIQTVTGLMIAVSSGLVMQLAGLENAAFWALALFLLSFIPVLGVAIGSVAPALFALLQFPTIGPAVAVFLGIQAVSFVVGNLILPRMQARSQNIDPSASLLAIGVWSIVWGIPGAFLAVPLTLALMFQLAQFDSLRWLAILISNDGRPLPELGAEVGERP